MKLPGPIPPPSGLRRLDGTAGAARAAAPRGAVRAASSGGVERLTITTPDDWHLHVRDGDSMRSVVPHTAAHFARAIIMPNLVPPVSTTDMVRSGCTATTGERGRGARRSRAAARGGGAAG